jgi:hypothetical protein
MNFFPRHVQCINKYQTFLYFNVYDPAGMIEIISYVKCGRVRDQELLGQDQAARKPLGWL